MVLSVQYVPLLFLKELELLANVLPKDFMKMDSILNAPNATENVNLVLVMQITVNPVLHLFPKD